MAGTRYAIFIRVLSFFMLGRTQHPWQLTPTNDGCELSLHYSTGTITEYFKTASAALRRAQQLDALLSSPRHHRRPRKATIRHRRRR